MEHKQSQMLFSQAIDDLGIGHLKEIIMPLIQPAIRLVRSSIPSTDELGVSHIGGQPDLPIGVIWPQVIDTISEEHRHLVSAEENTPLPFLAQINLSEIAALDVQNILPKDGWLYLFGGEQFPGCVLFASADSTLQPAEFPDPLSAEYRYPPFRLVTECVWTLPFYGTHGTIGGDPCFHDVLDPDIANQELSDQESDAYNTLPSLLNKQMIKKYGSSMRPEFHQMLGWADYIQNPQQMSFQADEERLYQRLERWGDDSWPILTDPNHPETRALRERAQLAKWTLLLQLDSIHHQVPDMMWGDGGMLYWWIKEEDIRRRDFSRIQFDFQCH